MLRRFLEGGDGEVVGDGGAGEGFGVDVGVEPVEDVEAKGAPDLEAIGVANACIDGAVVVRAPAVVEVTDVD